MFKSSRILMNTSSSQLPRDAFGRVPKNLYQILGLNRKASQKEIKQAFISLAKQYHPDNKNGGDQELFRELNEAYKVLSDTMKRTEYDLEIQQEENAFKFEEQHRKDNEFSNLFGEGKRVRTINLSEEDKQRFMEMMKKKKMDNFEGMRKSQEHMFVDLRKQRRSPVKLILSIIGIVVFLWSIKLSMWYNSVYKKRKELEEVSWIQDFTWS